MSPWESFPPFSAFAAQMSVCLEALRIAEAGECEAVLAKGHFRVLVMKCHWESHSNLHCIEL